MKPSEALKLARVTLCNEVYFICEILHAIDTPGAHKAEAHIGNLLAPHTTYGTWLWYHDRAWHSKYENTPDAHIEARLCWIDDMIKYWESKGE